MPKAVTDSRTRHSTPYNLRHCPAPRLAPASGQPSSSRALVSSTHSTCSAPSTSTAPTSAAQPAVSDECVDNDDPMSSPEPPDPESLARDAYGCSAPVSIPGIDQIFIGGTSEVLQIPAEDCIQTSSGGPQIVHTVSLFLILLAPHAARYHFPSARCTCCSTRCRGGDVAACCQFAVCSDCINTCTLVGVAQTQAGADIVPTPRCQAFSTLMKIKWCSLSRPWLPSLLAASSSKLLRVALI